MALVAVPSAEAAVVVVAGVHDSLRRVLDRLAADGRSVSIMAGVLDVAVVPAEFFFSVVVSGGIDLPDGNGAVVRRRRDGRAIAARV